MRNNDDTFTSRSRNTFSRSFLAALRARGDDEHSHMRTHRFSILITRKGDLIAGQVFDRDIEYLDNERYIAMRLDALSKIERYLASTHPHRDAILEDIERERAMYA